MTSTAPEKREAWKIMLATLSRLTARALAPMPSLLEWHLRKAKDYVDWRCGNNPIICRTDFGAAMSCRLTDLLQRKVAYFGVWEPNLTAYFKRALRPGDMLADVGANVGYYALLGSSLVGRAGRVISIEALPSIYSLLLENLRLNNSANVRAVNLAASDVVGEMPIFASSADNIGRSSTIAIEGNDRIGTIPSKPLHQIMTAEEMAACRLIKIDIEGAEPPVVRSILQNIGLYGPACEIALEVSLENAGLLAELEGFGFHAYLLENEYRDAPYIQRMITPPTRFAGKIETQSDFIFSRRDVAAL